VTHGIGGKNILVNPTWGGNVQIGYNPYGFNEFPKDTIPNSRLAVKGNISTSYRNGDEIGDIISNGKLIGNGLKLGNWDIVPDDKTICFNNSSSGLNIKKCFGADPVITTDGNINNISFRGGNPSSYSQSFNENWKLTNNPNYDQPVQSYTAELKNPNQRYSYNIWINLNDYTFNSVNIRFLGHRANMNIFSCPAPFSIENKKLLKTHRFPKENPNQSINTLDVSIQKSEMPTNYICINIGDDNKQYESNADYYYYTLFQKLYIL
jgi:hypothetical protein